MCNMKKSLCILFFIFYIFSFANAIPSSWQSAFSLGMSGSHSAVASGLEALTYNPAGISTTPYRFGVNLFGNFTFDLMTNFFSVYDFVEVLETLKSDNPSVDDFFSRQLDWMSPDGVSLTSAMSLSFFSFYAKLQSFYIGFSLDNKIFADVTVGKDLFLGIFDKLSLVQPLNEKFYGRFMWYQDFKFVLSTKIPKVEKLLPIRGLYAGISGHFYLPIIYTSFYSDLSLHTGDTDEKNGLYQYALDINCDFVYGSVLGKHVFKNVQLPEIDGLDLQSILENGGNFGMGIGVDLGILADINKYIKIGFSVTDLGFMFYAGSQRTDIDTNVVLDILKATEIIDSLKNVIKDFDNARDTKDFEFFMPLTAFHLGFSVNPLHRSDITITLPLSFTVGDFYSVQFGGLPTFELSTGIEIMPIFYWFDFPLRLSVGFSSASGFYTGLGFGIHLGACQLEAGLKGLEALFMTPPWTGRDFAVGCSVNFTF